MIESCTHQPEHWQLAHASAPRVWGAPRFGVILEVLMPEGGWMPHASHEGIVLCHGKKQKYPSLKWGGAVGAVGELLNHIPHLPILPTL